MPHHPQIERREAQPYVALPTTVPMDGLASAVDRGFAHVFGWLAARGVRPAGAPFIRYLSTDLAPKLEIELGVPVAIQVPGEGDVRADALPAGDYVTLLHVGRYDELLAANAALQSWGRDHGIAWARNGGTRWCARVEHYLTNPAEEPDSSKWQTLLAYLTASE